MLVSGSTSMLKELVMLLVILLLDGERESVNDMNMNDMKAMMESAEFLLLLPLSVSALVSALGALLLLFVSSACF